jgi:hypothetical protein
MREVARTRRLALALGAVLLTLGVAVPQALAAAQYSITDLGPTTQNGAADAISPSGLTAGMECASWNSGVLTHSFGNCGLFAGVNSQQESVGPFPQPSSTGTGPAVQAISETPPAMTPDDFLTGPLTNEYPSLVNPTQSASAIDDAGEIGGGVLSQPGGATGLVPYGYIFNPSAPAGAQVTLLPSAYDVYGLWPAWAEVESNQPTGNGAASYLGLYNRATATTTVTNLQAPSQGGVTADLITSSLASDGTLVGLTFGPCVTNCNIYGNVAFAPTMRLPDGSEVTLDIPAGYVGTTSQANDVNASHYSVGQVHATGAIYTEAAEWSPTGQFELLNDLIPSGLGWDLQNAVAISDNGAIVGTGTLNGVNENFLLTNNSTLPTSTSGACVPNGVGAGVATACTFTVADLTPGVTQTPTGTVMVSSNKPGSLAPASTCTLAASATPGQATCALKYTPSAAETSVLTAIYSGDTEHSSSQGSVTVGPTGTTPGTGTGSVTGHPKTTGTSASASVSCTGNAGSTCTMTLTLTVNQTLTGNKIVAVSATKHRSKKHHRTVVVGAKTITLAAGTHESVNVPLNATGKSLLKRRHTLAAKLTMTQKGGPSSTFTLTFKATTKKKKHKHH